MMEIKPGVKLKGIRPEILVALMVARDVYHVYGQELVVTCGLDGHENRPQSLHNSGLAVDLRTRIFPTETQKRVVADELQKKLGDEFDVVLEVDHIHVEFDPK